MLIYKKLFEVQLHVMKLNLFTKSFILLSCLFLIGSSGAIDKEEIAIENELNENSVVALNEDNSAALQTDSSPKVENTEYEFHSPQVENSLESEDLMMVETPGLVKATLAPGHTDGDEEDIMERTKRETSPSFSDIFEYISKKGSMSNEKKDVLTAKATASMIDDDNDKTDDHPTSKKGKRGKRNASSTKGEMKSIFSELKSSKHHKLTRSDIRQLAKKAVMLATLKKLDESKSNTSAKKSTIAVKPTDKRVNMSSKSTKKHRKKHSRKGKKKHKIEKQISASKKSTSETTTASVTTDTKPATLTKESEMAEDLSQTKKNILELSDDTMQKTDKADNSDTYSADLMPSRKSDPTTTLTSDSPTSSIIDKKSAIAQIDKSVENIFDDDDNSLNVPKPTENVKKSTLPGTELSDKMTSLKSFLEKANPSKIPSKFLPDLPSGLRMIGWKELIEKKKKQLSEIESAVGSSDVATEVKPVTVNIDVNQDSTEKEAAGQSDSLLDVTADKKTTDTDPISLQHVGYLQRHIKTARSLRKLIAKTLVGHCKSTGKRILDAFVAMDKALARAQTIASVIGKKFNIDIDRIDALVGDKEDQVVETFLKDIFTKI